MAKQFFLLSSGVLLLTACAGEAPKDDVLLDTGCEPADSDGDGLTDCEEIEIGTDPSVEDTDGDGHADGAELSGNTDPLDAEDHPYTGGWPIADCRDDIVPTGITVGDISPDWALMDQFGDTVRLHSFCDRTVLVVSSAFW